MAITTIAHPTTGRITVGVDTHGDTHVAHANDQLGRRPVIARLRHCAPNAVKAISVGCRAEAASLAGLAAPPAKSAGSPCRTCALDDGA